MRSVSIASDGSALVAGNHKVCLEPPPIPIVDGSSLTRLFTGGRLRVDHSTWCDIHRLATQDQVPSPLSLRIKQSAVRITGDNR